jgi:hypothetical protein
MDRNQISSPTNRWVSRTHAAVELGAGLMTTAVLFDLRRRWAGRVLDGEIVQLELPPPERRPVCQTNPHHMAGLAAPA